MEYPQIFPAPVKMLRAEVWARKTTRLDLLKDIDAAVDELTSCADAFREMASAFSKFENTVPSCPAGTFIDPDDRVISRFESMETVLKSYIPNMTAKGFRITRDSRLTPDHKESLRCACEDVTNAAAILHEAARAARGAIIGHDLEAERRETLPVFNTADALIADLYGA